PAPAVTEESSCCAPAAVVEETSCCAPAAVVEETSCCAPAAATTPAKDEEQPAFHDTMGKLLDTFDVNAYAASVKIFAVKPLS
ncbi:MAG: hypothetical protein JKY65_22410, partial [Planctomycetes bacterium]|nr:hypothetical protein [Planctomycetota bacterium]